MSLVSDIRRAETRVGALSANMRERAGVVSNETRAPRETLRPWLEEVSPTFSWNWRHLVHVQEHLDAMTRGEVKRLMIFMPPRHGKSEMTTVRYSSYRIERNPETRVIVGAYNQTLANKFSRKVRRITRERLDLSKERSAVEDWETASGGGLRAVGVGGGITGQGGDLIIIDDPIKNREEAESATYRERVWEWYTDDLYTRAEPDASIVLMMTRWHDDDLAGRILASEDAGNWTVISLPAEAVDGDPLGREVGEALCPERYDLKALARIKLVLGRSFHALYQQAPRAREGDMFKRSWFEIVDAAPKEASASVRWWDKAATHEGGDWTVGVKLQMHGDTFYILDVIRGQWSSGKRDEKIRETAEMDGHGVTQWTEQEPGSGGKDSAEAFVRLLKGYVARFRTATGSKETRAEPFASYAECNTKEEGRVKLLRGAWIPAFMDELCNFPMGKHDDQVDAASGAFSVLARNSRARSYNFAGFASLADLTQESPWIVN